MDKVIHFAAGVPHCQIEFPPKGVRRSRSGALYVRPGTVVVTEDELGFIQKNHRALRRFTRVIADVKPRPEDALSGADDSPSPTDADDDEDGDEDTSGLSDPLA